MDPVPEELTFNRANELWTQVQFKELACERDRGGFSGGEETPSQKIREGFLGRGSLDWALKDPSDMETQMCKERYSGGRSIWNKGAGLGKECCCVDSLKVEARGAVLGGPSIVPGALSEVKTS